MDWAYLAFEVRSEHLQQALRSLVALGVQGINLTIPHKEVAVGMVDELAPSARFLGAVNTVQVKDDRLIGHNTDASGFLRSLAEADVSLTGASAVLVGAGGAARAIAFALAQAGVTHLTITNRTPDKAFTLAKQIEQHHPALAVAARALGDAGLRKAVVDAALVVNATSVGMPPQEAAAPLAEEWLQPGQLVVDIIYRPAQTRLLQAAERRGCRTLNGVKMLVWQGAEAFALWTGTPAPVAVMERALLQALVE